MPGRQASKGRELGGGVGGERMECGPGPSPRALQQQQAGCGPKAGQDGVRFLVLT